MTALQLVLGLVLAAAGVAKLRSLPSFRDTLSVLGVPETFRRSLAAVIPLLEISCGGCLIAGVGVPIVAAGVALLIGLFTVVVVVALRRGQIVRCNCFGAFSDERMSWRTVLRNVFLIFVASVVAVVDSAGTAQLPYASQELPLLVSVVVLLASLLLSREVRRFRRVLIRTVHTPSRMTP